MQLHHFPVLRQSALENPLLFQLLAPQCLLSLREGRLPFLSLNIRLSTFGCLSSSLFLLTLKEQLFVLLL